MTTPNIDFVMWRDTESGDFYHERYKANDIQDLKSQLQDATDIGYTADWGFITIVGDTDEIEETIYEVIDYCY